MTLHKYLSHAIAKPLVAGIAAKVADRLIMKNESLKSNLYFAGSVGGGIAAIAWIEPIASKSFPTKTPLGHVGKFLEGRIVKIAFGSAAAYAVSRFVLDNEMNPKNMMYKVAIVAGSDIIGETVCELLAII